MQVRVISRSGPIFSQIHNSSDFTSPSMPIKKKKKKKNSFASLRLMFFTLSRLTTKPPKTKLMAFQESFFGSSLIAGSCHGLVLVVAEENIKYLFNDESIGSDLGSLYANWRQKGKNLEEDDYYEPDIKSTFVDIYSMREGLWRRPESSPYDHSFNDLDSRVLVNRALHWLASRTSHYSFLIVAFDVSDEKFLEVPTSTIIDNNNVGYYDLVALKGSLCMLAYQIAYPEENKIDVWMMREYGVEESWTKFRIIGLNVVYSLTPLLMSGDDIVFKVDIGNIDGISTPYGGARTFMESLVSWQWN
ncbi:F-box/kelch-repeat protein At3g06240-like [Nicotiana tabacum]|uniref:F-box/kelch-repeat protein At3g06240-like n=1 Tax=Nicotiana tabacum TaxID=4097 RepID=A0A1S4AIZ4_TOBAC|nr:PREDICTED: F-box/kelch-repeat protein At3g06240-like [Nicotiana tabacum]